MMERYCKFNRVEQDFHQEFQHIPFSSLHQGPFSCLFTPFLRQETHLFRTVWQITHITSPALF